jgi:hypothetical protein
MPLPAAGEENLQTGCLEPDSSCFLREICMLYPYALTLYPIPYTLYCGSTLHPDTLYPIPYTLYPIPYTLYTLHFTLGILHVCTLYPHFGLDMAHIDLLLYM